MHRERQNKQNTNRLTVRQAASKAARYTKRTYSTSDIHTDIQQQIQEGIYTYIMGNREAARRSRQTSTTTMTNQHIYIHTDRQTEGAGRQKHTYRQAGRHTKHTDRQRAKHTGSQTNRNIQPPREKSRQAGATHTGIHIYKKTKNLHTDKQADRQRHQYIPPPLQTYSKKTYRHSGRHTNIHTGR